MKTYVAFLQGINVSGKNHILVPFFSIYDIKFPSFEKIETSFIVEI